MVTDQKTHTRNVKATSFYLTPAQLRKLDELAFQLNERSDQRINRNDIVRHLVDHCSFEDLAELRGQEE
jgi:hypothetical protein